MSTIVKSVFDNTVFGTQQKSSVENELLANNQEGEDFECISAKRKAKKEKRKANRKKRGSVLGNIFTGGLLGAAKKVKNKRDENKAMLDEYNSEEYLNEELTPEYSEEDGLDSDMEEMAGKSDDFEFLGFGKKKAKTPVKKDMREAQKKLKPSVFGQQNNFEGMSSANDLDLVDYSINGKKDKIKVAEMDDNGENQGESLAKKAVDKPAIKTESKTSGLKIVGVSVLISAAIYGITKLWK